ncbi:hypothetical protein [Stenomitos frigidus]|nr:hypothetical protein [Stenomitos frigidus]
MPQSLLPCDRRLGHHRMQVVMAHRSEEWHMMGAHRDQPYLPG